MGDICKSAIDTTFIQPNNNKEICIELVVSLTSRLNTKFR
jgi:hypothetical protein